MRFPLLVLLTFLVLTFFVTSSVAQEASAQPQAFVKVERVGDPNRQSFFLFSTSIRNYTIRNDGFTESFSDTVQRRFFNLRMGQNSSVERVYFMEYEGDLVLLYEVGDKKYGWGYLARLDQPERRFRWVTPINGFNVGPAIVEAGSVYFSSANVIGKVDLRSGEYVWKQTEFEKKYQPAFFEFRLPFLAADRVMFEEALAEGRTIELDKNSGAIINLHHRPQRPAFEPSKTRIRNPKFTNHQSHKSLTLNVSPCRRSPLSSPLRNQRMRCSEVPCVKESGTT